MRWFWVVIALIAVSILIGSHWLKNDQFERHVSITMGKALLDSAYKQYLKDGTVTTNHPSYKLWMSTNSVMIGGTNYSCFAQIQWKKAYGESSLAMTTNRTFIWLDSKGPPRILDEDHRFPPGF